MAVTEKNRQMVAVWVKAEVSTHDAGLHKVAGLSLNGPLLIAEPDELGVLQVYIDPLEAFVIAERLKEAALAATKAASEDALEKVFKKALEKRKGPKK